MWGRYSSTVGTALKWGGGIQVHIQVHQASGGVQTVGRATPQLLRSQTALPYVSYLIAAFDSHICL